MLSTILWQSQRSHNWPQVSAKVLRTEIFEVPDKTRFAPLIEYSYDVAERSYISTSYDFNIFTTKDKRITEAILESFREKEVTQIYYHPWFPRFSVIVPGIKINKPLIFFLGAAVVLIVFSIYKITKVT